jgi:hypothetical protein
MESIIDLNTHSIQEVRNEIAKQNQRGFHIVNAYFHGCANLLLRGADEKFFTRDDLALMVSRYQDYTEYFCGVSDLAFHAGDEDVMVEQAPLWLSTVWMDTELNVAIDNTGDLFLLKGTRDHGKLVHPMVHLEFHMSAIVPAENTITPSNYNTCDPQWRQLEIERLEKFWSLQ